jgi:hypothetical protein
MEMEQKMENAENSKNAKEFSCDNCKFYCSKKSDWKRHIDTQKHYISINGNNLENKKAQKDPQYNICILCNKQFKSYSGLWKHKNKCNNITNKDNNNNNNIQHITEDKIELLINENIDFKHIMLELVKSNTELHKQMIEVCKNTTSGVNNSYNHSNNKTFNMQVFLNEKCKDAMNIMDFVNSMTLDFSDLEELGELGYVEGISRQLIRKLSEMDVYKRPIHCSDLKRETMYVRDNDVWEKETDTYDNLRKVIKYITKKNGDLMIPWRNAHPQCMNLQHPLNDTYLGIMNQAMGGKGEFAESESKIIRKISKCVTIDKKDM